jgi:flavin-dependent dehydrogenase
MSAREKKASLDLGVLGGGYAGIIDKGTHLILGYYLRGNRLHKDFLERMAGYCEAFSLEFGGEKFVHKVLPLYSRDAPIARGRIFLLGDAGGLVDPLSGEGIRHAVKSGLLASRVVLEGLGAAKYDALIRQEIGTELVLAWKLAGFAYRFPRVAQQGMVRVGFEAVEVLNGRQTYLHLLERLKARIRRTFGLETSRKR